MIELDCKICAPTDAVSRDFREAVEVLEGLEIGWCELRTVGRKLFVDLAQEERKKTRSLLLEAGLSVAILDSSVGSASLDDDPNYQLGALRQWIEAAQSVGASRIGVAAFRVAEPDLDRRRAEVVGRLRKFADIAELGDVTLLVENVPGTYCHSAQQLGDLVNGVNSPCVQASFNPAISVAQHRHPFSAGFCRGPMKRHLGTLRIRDAIFEDGRTVLPEQGNAELRALVSAAVCRGFSGLLSVDPGLDPTPAGFRQAYGLFQQMLAELF